MFLHHFANNNKGQVLLTSVIAIAVISLVIASSLILVSINSFKVILAARQSAEAAALTNACAEEALYRVNQTNFLGSGSVIIDSKTCNFTVQDLGSNQRLISTSSTILGVVKKTEIKINVSQPNNVIKVIYWKEVP